MGINKTVKEVKGLWMKYYSELAKPNKEVLEIIKDLHTKYKVFLFSNTTEMSNNHNSKTGLYDYFDDLFLSYRLGMKKPDQQIYRKTISLIGCKAEECVFIDDLQVNIAGFLINGTHILLAWIMMLPNLF